MLLSHVQFLASGNHSSKGEPLFGTVRPPLTRCPVRSDLDQRQRFTLCSAETFWKILMTGAEMAFQIGFLMLSQQAAGVYVSADECFAVL